MQTRLGNMVVNRGSAEGATREAVYVMRLERGARGDGKKQRRSTTVVSLGEISSIRSVFVSKQNKQWV